MCKVFKLSEIVRGMVLMWECPKIRGTLFWGPYNKDPTIEGTIFGSPIFGTPMLFKGCVAKGSPRKLKATPA